MKAEIKISGMMCMHCVGRVEKALKAVQGVSTVSVDLKDGSAEVEFDAPAELSMLKDAIIKAGYEVVA